MKESRIAGPKGEKGRGPDQIPVFILAGGRGTRLSEETHAVPKPMVEIGDVPILVHLMRWYASHGFNDFVICGGYRVWDIKQYFLNYYWRNQSIELDLRKGENRIRRLDSRVIGESPIQRRIEDWRVRVIDTGLDCMTGGRLARAFDVVSQEQEISDFAVTYGDGLCDVNLLDELKFHQSHSALGTVLGVHPLARFGELEIDSKGWVRQFLEKPQARQGFINGGFFFFKKGFRQLLSTEESCVLEREPVVALAERQQLKVFRHEGFWHPMDTLRDKQTLQSLWESGQAPWKVSGENESRPITDRRAA